MAKSKYPAKFAVAQKAHTNVNKAVIADGAKFKKLAKAFSDGATVAKSLPGNYLKNYGWESDEMVSYGKSVAMILEYEEQMDAAGGDAKKEKELKKKISAEEKKIDGYVNNLAELRKSYAALRALAQAQIAAAQGIYDTLEHSL